jgi:hypothetical protein
MTNLASVSMVSFLSPEVLEQWLAEKQEQFGARWSEVESILWSLQRYGVYLVDVTPANVALIP